MRKKPSKEALAARCAELERENNLLNLALQDLGSGIDPDYVDGYDESEDSTNRYRLSLYRSAGAMAGYVVTAFYCNGQRTQVSVGYLDDMPRTTGHCERDCAMERMVIARNRALAT